MDSNIHYQLCDIIKHVRSVVLDKLEAKHMFCFFI